MNNQFQQYLGLVSSVAMKWFPHFIASTYEIDDLKQEAFLVYVKAKEKFDESKGFAFSTYFVTSLNHHFLSLARTSSKIRFESLSDDGDKFLDFLVDASENPEIEIEASLMIEKSLDGLSALGKLFFELLVEPPQFVKEEFAALEAKRAIAHSKGIDERYPSEINLNFVSAILGDVGFSKHQLNKAKLELKRLEACNDCL